MSLDFIFLNVNITKGEIFFKWFYGNFIRFMAYSECTRFKTFDLPFRLLNIVWEITFFCILLTGGAVCYSFTFSSIFAALLDTTEALSV